MRRAALALTVAMAAASCGYIGDPLPPALNIPNPVQDLRAQQVESRLELAFTIPPKTTENLPLTDIATVELRVGRLPEGTWNIDTWAAGAKAVRVDAAKPGPVETDADVREFAGAEVALAVRMANKKGRSSAWSNVVTMRVETPVVTPAEFDADSAPNGAVVTWKGYDGPVMVFRNGTLVGEGAKGTYFDARAELGKSYQYEIQARGDKAQGKRVGPKTVTVEDRFAPGPPGGLNVVAGAGTVELSWNPNPENDISGYAVQRAEGAGAFSVVAAFVEAPAYTDRNVQRGMRYRYTVTAIDLRKNESGKSQEVEITVP